MPPLLRGEHMLIPAPMFPSAEEDVPHFMLDVKRQRDNVHDFVYLNEIERTVLDTPEVQRLRGIKQLGFAHLVYETAEHSRFSHSVGVCHSAKLLVDIINRNHRILDESTVAAKTAVTSSELFPTPPEPAEVALARVPKIPWAQRICIGLAALLHDLPHPPMSHALEHESSVVVKHDDVAENPQLYLFLFGEGSGVAKALREYSKRFQEYLVSLKDKLKLSLEDIQSFLASNGLGEKDLLAGFVFEILAFKSPEKHPHQSFQYKRDWPSESEPFTFSKFFRPFFADLISNTICADLIDYLLRDALNTGIQKAIDLKFLDRMYIGKQPDDQPDETRVLFDLNDRRGGLRKDAVSDLLSLLESRYSLMERVYMHRTKLAASAMLGRAYLMCKEGSATAGPCVDPKRLYEATGYPSDDALLRHLMREGPIPAKHLVESILNRRIYQPLFIIDEEGCRKRAVSLDKGPLVRLFRPKPKNTNDWRKVMQIDLELAAALCPSDPYVDEKHPFVVFCMEERVAYKDPRVLVDVPANRGRSGKDDDTTIKEIPDTKGVLQLLRDFTSDHGTQSQIASMLTNYNTLWKLYVFADMDLVKRNAANIPSVYAVLVKAINIAYPISGMWETCGKGSRLTEKALKAAVKKAAKQTEANKNAPKELMPFLTHATLTGDSQGTWADKLREVGIKTPQYSEVWSQLWRRFQSKRQTWDWSTASASKTQSPEWKRWLYEQLANIAQNIEQSGNQGDDHGQ